MTRAEIMAWRKAERIRLLAERWQLPTRTLRDASTAIAAALLDRIRAADARIVSLYWPINREPSLLALADQLDREGRRVALPIVAEKGRPLVFRTWRKGDAMTKGFWNIPIPADGEQVIPDFLVAPVVGHDAASYRLGYGGGYFDRTLATLPGAHVVGIGYAAARIATIHPLPHDIPMRAILTEEGPVG